MSAVFIGIHPLFIVLVLARLSKQWRETGIWSNNSRRLAPGQNIQSAVSCSRPVSCFVVSTQVPSLASQKTRAMHLAGLAQRGVLAVTGLQLSCSFCL